MFPCLSAGPVQLYEFPLHLHSQSNVEIRQVQNKEVPTQKFQLQIMEHRLKQRRASFSDPQSQKHDKAWNWLRRANFQDEYAKDDAHVIAVAAAAFSIHSLEEAGGKMKEGPKISRTGTMRGKNDNLSKRPSYGGETSVKRSFGEDPRTTESAFSVRRPSGIFSPRPIPPASAYQKQIGNPLQHNNDKAEAWEQAKAEKIQKRYERIKFQILSWESEKKIQAKLHVERKKSELEHRRAMATQHYRNKVARIDKIKQGAITQLEAKRRKEVSKARAKANKIRKTGMVPVKCFCFSY